MASADWSSLPAELLNHIANCFLATSDLDYYMDFRAVCHSWRSATEDPKSSPDPHFRPRHWAIVDRHFGRDKTYLWVNTATGRFVPKELPLLRGYWGSSTTPDGLLILNDNKSDAISLLNAFTGYWIHFAAPPPPSEQIIESAALVSGSPPTLVLSCKKMDIDDDFVLHETNRRVYTAHPDSNSFTVYEERHACPLIRLALRGIYTNGELGLPPFPNSVAEKIFDLMKIYNAEPDESSDDEDTLMSDEKAAFNFLIGYENRCYLVRSAGKILIIFKIKRGMEVFRMDTDSYVLERAMNIGNRAIFLSGNCKCISVNADKYPSIEANCIYYIKSLDYSRDYICMYNLRSQTVERISRDMGSGSRPYTIIQHLLSYNLQ